MCTPNDVVVTHIAASSITFQLHVADGQLATQVAADIQANFQGDSFVASLVANGVTDASSLQNMVFGSISVEAEPESGVPQVDAQVEAAKPVPLRTIPLCKLSGVMLMVVLAMVALSVLVVRNRSQSMHVELVIIPAEEPNEAPVVDVEKAEYAKVAVDETSKDQA